MPSNAELHRRMDEALNRGDTDAARQFMAEDVVTHFPGENPFAGDFHGRDAFFEAFGRVAAATEEFSIEHRDLLGSAEHSVALTRLSVARGGRSFEGDAVDLCRWRDGLVVEEWVIPLDQRAWDAFWS